MTTKNKETKHHIHPKNKNKQTKKPTLASKTRLNSGLLRPFTTYTLCNDYDIHARKRTGPYCYNPTASSAYTKTSFDKHDGGY